MTPDSRAEGFVAGTRKIVQILRYGPRELALALLGFLLLGAIPLLPELAERLPFLTPTLPWVTGVLVVLGLFLLGFAAWRIWKKAVAPLPEAKPKPAAIKGPAPFGPQDAELFARLGRNDDLNRLRDWILDDQKPLVALMGESGVGKTSLLRAGLARHLQGDKIPVLYWEAVPTEPEAKLLHAVQELWEEKQKAPNTFDGLAPIVASGRRVVVIDQAEQLSPEGHPRIFKLLRQVAEGDPPYQATWVVAFRREFLPVWRDFELSMPEPVQRRMETLSLQRFSPKTAEKVIAVLAEEGSLPVDQKLVEKLVEGVAVEGKVSPADIGISLLVLSELAGGRLDASLSLDDFRENGGQAGLLTRYLEKLLELFPEAERPEVLRGLLALVDLEKDQRVAEGRTVAELEEVVKPASLPRFAAALRLLASSKARVLEELPGEPVRYRLVHERLIPAIRKLTGVLLAEAERASLALERGYRVWAQERQSRFLLHRKDLEEVHWFKDQIRWGKEEADKREFVRLSRRRETWRRLIVVAAVVAGIGVLLGLAEFTRKREYQSLLATWGLPPDLYDHLEQLEELTLPGTVTRLDWLRDAKRLKRLTVEDGMLESLEGLPAGLQTLTVGESRLSNLSGLPTALTMISLGPSRLRILQGLPRGLHSLKLNLGNDSAFTVPSLPRSLRYLQISLPNRAWNANFKELTNLQALTLTSKGRTNLSLGNSLPAGLRSLELHGLNVASLKELPRNLQNLVIFDPSGFSFGGLPADLERLKSLKYLHHLGISHPYIWDSQAIHLPPMDLSNFPALRSLELRYPEHLAIATLPALPESLTHLKVSAPNVVRLRNLPRLGSIELWCQFVLLDEDLPKGLKSLEFSGAKITLESKILDAKSFSWRPYLKAPDVSLPVNLQSLILEPHPRLYDLVNGWRGRLPPSLKKLRISWLPNFPLPAGLRSLDITGSNIPERLSLPDGLTELNLSRTLLRELPSNLQRLTSLDISSTLIGSVASLPPSLKSLSLAVRQVETLKGLPESVTAIHFHREAPQDSGPW